MSLFFNSQKLKNHQNLYLGIHLLLLALSATSLGLSLWAKSLIHPKEPVAIYCDPGMEGELKRAGEQLESISGKIVQYK